MHAYEAWGEAVSTVSAACLPSPCGTATAKRLASLGDRLGVKPLFYALLDDGTFLFGSELKSLLAHGGLKREIDPCAVEEYFALGYVPSRGPSSSRQESCRRPIPCCYAVVRQWACRANTGMSDSP